MIIKRKVSRFGFLLLFIFIVFSCKENQNMTYSSTHFDLIKLAEGVYGCIHKFGGKATCNVGIIDNGKETLIFDTFLSPSVAEELKTLIKALNLSPIKYVVNSHFHNDHIRGNQVFSPEIPIISTSRTAALIEEWEPKDIKEEKEYAPSQFSYYDSLYNAFKGDTSSRAYKQILMWRPYYQTLAESHKEIKTRLPNMFVDDQQDFNGPDRKVQLISKGKGHTESDLILYLPDDEILFTGDLVFNESHPYLAHGYLKEWKEYLNFLNDLNATTIIPGHGQIGSKTIINTMKDYISSVELLADDMISQDLKSKDAVNVEIPVKYEKWWFDRFFLPNLKFAYNTISEK